ASTVACEARIPFSSSGPWRSSAMMSYQARMANPPLSVTGRIGACGNTKRSARSPGRTSSGTRGSKSWPSAPRPWSQITAPAGSRPVSTSTASPDTCDPRCLHARAAHVSAPAPAPAPKAQVMARRSRRLPLWPAPAVRRRWLRRWRRAPPPVRVSIGVLLVAMLTLGVNGIYQVVRKPTELFFPVSGTLYKTPSETWRVLPGHAVELTSAYLDLKVNAILARFAVTRATSAQQRHLAAAVHLCGAALGATYVRQGFRFTDTQRCGDQDPRAYLGRVDAMQAVFARLAAEQEGGAVPDSH